MSALQTWGITVVDGERLHEPKECFARWEKAREIKITLRGLQDVENI